MRTKDSEFDFIASVFASLSQYRQRSSRCISRFVLCLYAQLLMRLLSTPKMKGPQPRDRGSKGSSHDEWPGHSSLVIWYQICDRHRETQTEG